MRFLRLFLFLSASLVYAEQVTVTVLATTDLHGNIFPIDYTTDRPVPRGLAKLATIIRAAEAENPNHLLIDCGDTIQGTPLEYAYQTLVRTGRAPLGLPTPADMTHDPMMLAMNRLGYDAMTVGNHEFNFGLKNLSRARADARFPWLSANTVGQGSEKSFAPYIVKTAGGIKVAVIGLTTPAVPTWEKPENIGSYKFQSPVEAARKAVAELRAREHPDLILVAAHAGMGRNPDTNQPEDPAENFVYDLATAVPELDAIVFGHSHRLLEDRRIGRVLVTQPKNAGASVARMDFTLEREGSGPWTVAAKKSRLIAATAATEPAADILALARPYQDLAERYLATPVAASDRPLDAVLGRVEDTALVDAVHQVQLYYARADVSFASVFNPAVRIPKGQVTVRQVAAMYPYENELYAIEGTGKMVKEALENAARYYLSCQGARCAEPPLIDRNIIGYNYDMAEGVTYQIDLNRPAGDRVRDLRWKGAPLAPETKLRIAVNNYRAAGSAGYSMFVGAPILWRSGDEIRDLIVRYYTERKQLPGEASGNWRVVPEQARLTLEKEAASEAGRPGGN